MRLGMKVGVLATCLALGLAGCGDDKGSSAAGTDSASASEGGTTQGSASATDGTASASASATEATEGGMSASGTGTTDQSGSNGESATMGGSSETEGGSDATGQESQGGSGGSETNTTEEPPPETSGEPLDCAGAESKEACEALGCTPIEGLGFEFDQAIWCINGNASYLGCIEPSPCDQAITYACKGQNVYELPNGCLPNGFKTCDAPPDPQMDGYPPC